MCNFLKLFECLAQLLVALAITYTLIHMCAKYGLKILDMKEFH